MTYIPNNCKLVKLWYIKIVEYYVYMHQGLKKKI